MKNAVHLCLKNMMKMSLSGLPSRLTLIGRTYPNAKRLQRSSINCISQILSLKLIVRGMYMKLFPPEPTVDLYNEGFGDEDILQRQRVGQSLSSLLDGVNDPLVVALDGNWGTGKSYFLKRWVGAHTIENGSNATTVYFDAFANDYVSDPLPALVSALAERLPEEDGETLQRVKLAAFKLAKPLARIGLSLATFGAMEAVGELGDAIVGAANGEIAAGMEKYWEDEVGKRAAMNEFRNAIETLVAPEDDGGVVSPLVFVIDELDRCRPSYALEVLEIIKHFFAVPHVQFILGVNLKSLENSVRASYGTSIDAQSYLKKFIQVTLELPQKLGDIHNQRTAALTYLDFLIQEMEIPQHISNRLRDQFELVGKIHSISLRDTGTIASSIALASSEVLGDNRILPGWIDVLVDLVISRVIRPDLYPKLLNASISTEELASFIGSTEDVLTERLGEERNPNYNQRVYWRHQSWRYLVENGRLELDDPELVRQIGSQFHSYGMHAEARTVPQKVNNDWLDRFSFYRA